MATENIANYAFLILEELRVIEGMILTIEGHKLGLISNEDYIKWYIQAKALFEDLSDKNRTDGQQRIENIDGGSR